MSTATIFCSPFNPVIFLMPMPAAFVDCKVLLKLASRTSCVDEDADIDGRGKAVMLLLWRSGTRQGRSGLCEDETVIAGDVESLLL